MDKKKNRKDNPGGIPDALVRKLAEMVVSNVAPAPLNQKGDALDYHKEGPCPHLVSYFDMAFKQALAATAYLGHPTPSIEAYGEALDALGAKLFAARDAVTANRKMVPMDWMATRRYAIASLRTMADHLEAADTPKEETPS